jgi:hypothetical protein
MSRFSFGLSPSSHALRACTQIASVPASATMRARSNSAISGILLVDADAAFHRYRQSGGHCGLHRFDATRNQIRRLHQAGAERARLHPVGRAPDIEIDLVIAEIGGDPHRFGQLGRIAAAQLQRDRMLDGIVAQQALAVAMDHRVGHDHLGIKQRMARQLAMEEPAMPVRPVHHRRDGNFCIYFIHLDNVS